MFTFTEDQKQEFRQWIHEHFSASHLADETFMFHRLTDNPDCMESCLCDFAVEPKELLRDECIIRLARLSRKGTEHSTQACEDAEPRPGVGGIIFPPNFVTRYKLPLSP